MTIGIRAANPIWFFVDLVGQPLNDQYYISFLNNVFPYLPQPVYHDVNLTSGMEWANPLEFYPNGTLPDNMYWDPNKVWRLEIRQGPNQSDPLIYEINNFSPGQSNIIPNNLDIVTASNQITNPQFAEVYFANDLVITVAGTYNIAPGWNLIIEGAGGTTTLTQLVLTGSLDVNGNPPYALKIANVGWSKVTLEQRFNHNGALWQNGAVAGLVLARADGSSQTITMNYQESDGGKFKNLFTHIFTTANFQFFGGAVNIDNIPVAVNTDLSTVAYTNIDLVLPPNGTVDISNVQITGQTLPLPVNPLPFNQLPTYDQETIERNIDHQFNVFKDPLFYKQIPSYLVGWDFPLNPAQFLGSSIAAQPIGANKSYYVWDQTILFQSANSGITTARGASGDLFLTAAVNTQMAVIQYLPQAIARKVLNDVISVNLSCINFVAANTAQPLMISLWYTKDGSLPSTVGSKNSMVLTLDPITGKPATFNGNWIEVPPLNGQNAVAQTIGSITTNFNDYSFNGYWNLKGVADADLATFFAIVISSKVIVAGDYLRINSVGLQSGKIATRPAPQTLDDVIRECEYYYEKSYRTSIPVGTATLDNARFELTPIIKGAPDVVYFKTFQVNYNSVKNQIVDPVFYSPNNGALNFIYAGIRSSTGNAFLNTATTNWLLTGQGDKSAVMLINNDAALTTLTTNPANEGNIYYHYVVDARLGL